MYALVLKDNRVVEDSWILIDADSQSLPDGDAIILRPVATSLNK